MAHYPRKESTRPDHYHRDGHTPDQEQHSKTAGPVTTPQTEITEWRPLVSNTMRGLFSCLLPSGLLLHGCSLHVGDKGPWVSLPSKVRVSHGEVSTYLGKPVYNKVVEIPDRERRDAFQAAVLAALAAHPEAGRVLAGGGHRG